MTQADRWPRLQAALEQVDKRCALLRSIDARIAKGERTAHALNLVMLLGWTSAPGPDEAQAPDHD